MNKSKVSIVTNQIWQKVESIIGWTLVVFSVIFHMMNFADSDDEAFTTMLVFLSITLAIGIFLVIRGMKRKKLIRDFKNYVQILAGDPYNSLDTIAARTNTSVDVVRRNIELMISKHFFANAVIDRASNSLILNGKADTKQMLSANAMASLQPTVSSNNYPFQAQQNVEMLTVKCKGCGAINVVQRGRLVECEYCGNIIKGE